jgi:hypothetical protein
MRNLAAVALALVMVAFAGPASAQASLAPGFTALPPGAKVLLIPADIELFLVSAGGVPEPKADWTDAASRHFKSALLEKKRAFGLTTVELSEKDADDATEVISLHAAIAHSIALHHYGPLKLPTKEGQLDWSLGEAVEPIKRATGADYALFNWIRDSYASDERKAAMIAIAVLSLGRAVPVGGTQIGYASLVDLNTGRVVWFNRLARQSGDLREAETAPGTLDALLDRFPAAK